MEIQRSEELVNNNRCRIQNDQMQLSFMLDLLDLHSEVEKNFKLEIEFKGK